MFEACLMGYTCLTCSNCKTQFRSIIIFSGQICLWLNNNSHFQSSSKSDGAPQSLITTKKDSHCLETHFHDTILLHHYRWEAYIKKYWNVAIFKLRLLNDQHADCEYTWFRGKMTQTPVVVRHKTRFIANLSYVTYLFKTDLMYISKNGIQHVV